MAQSYERHKEYLAEREAMFAAIRRRLRRQGAYRPHLPRGKHCNVNCGCDARFKLRCEASDEECGFYVVP